MYYINIFLIYSFLGFIFENIMRIFLTTNFDSGILYGPWTFIYGIAIFIIMALNKFLKGFKMPKIVEVIIFFITVTILMTLIEFTGGMLIEKIFHTVYWDYGEFKFHYGHYISLEVSLLWGTFATLVNYLVTPKINKLEKKIPWYVTGIILLIFIVDVVLTIKLKI